MTACEAQTTRTVGDMFRDVGFATLEVDFRPSPAGRSRGFDSLARGRSRNTSCWPAPLILDGPLWRSLAAPAAAGYGCSTLTPDALGVNVLTQE